MRKILGMAAAMTVAAGALSAGAAFGTPSPVAGGPYVEDGHKVTICHRTGSATNPYVVITVDVAAINGDKKNDHSHHEQVGNGQGGDVIPPVTGYNDEGKDFYYQDSEGNWIPKWMPGNATPAACVGGGGGSIPS